MREARGELDDSRRDRLYQEFGRILYDEQPYTWLYVRPTMTLLNRRIKGVRPTLLGWVLEDWWLEDEPNRRVGAQ